MLTPSYIMSNIITLQYDDKIVHFSSPLFFLHFASHVYTKKKKKHAALGGIKHADKKITIFHPVDIDFIVGLGALVHR